MKTIDWNIATATTIIKQLTTHPNILPFQKEALEEAIKSIDDIDRWVKEARTVMDSWDKVRDAVEHHPDTLPGSSIAENALTFVRRDAVYQRSP